MLRVLDLFSGIGGFSLGLERTGGFETVAFCEIEEFPRRVLAKHWPEVPIYDDVRTLTGERLASDGIAVDVICGGFPCQDISTAGNGAGLAGERSGLWFEYQRLIREVRPQFVVVENVVALLHRGLDAVLGSLAEIGYDAFWDCIPASALGARHRRDRVWIIAYPAGDGRQGRAVWNEIRNAIEALSDHWRQLAGSGADDRTWALADAGRIDVEGLITRVAHAPKWPRSILGSLGPCRHVDGWWGSEPNVGRVADGVPDRAHRLRALGNAVVPQIPELIGRAILAHLNSPHHSPDDLGEAFGVGGGADRQFHNQGSTPE